MDIPLNISLPPHLYERKDVELALICETPQFKMESSGKLTFEAMTTDIDGYGNHHYYKTRALVDVVASDEGSYSWNGSGVNVERGAIIRFRAQTSNLFNEKTVLTVRLDSIVNLIVTFITRLTYPQTKLIPTTPKPSYKHIGRRRYKLSWMFIREGALNLFRYVRRSFTIS